MCLLKKKIWKSKALEWKNAFYVKGPLLGLKLCFGISNGGIGWDAQEINPTYSSILIRNSGQMPWNI